MFTDRRACQFIELLDEILFSVRNGMSIKESRLNAIAKIAGLYSLEKTTVQDMVTRSSKVDGIDLFDKALAFVFNGDDTLFKETYINLFPEEKKEEVNSVCERIKSAGLKITEIDNTQYMPTPKHKTQIPSLPALNRIFYGPPGTGKTYHTIKAAIEILAPELSESSREEQKTRFNTLLSEGKIRFVTFHQSFSYEDFVEGIRPNVSSENTITYSVFSGVFKELCNDAAGIKQNSPLYTGLELDGYTVEKISSEIVLLQKPRAGSKLPLPFLIVNELVALVHNGDISLVDIFSKSVFQRLEQLNITSTMEKYFVNGYPQPLGNIVKFIIENTNNSKNNSEPYVLIIDEINRGNISGIFGEVITLIEPSKRLGEIEELKVTLPYSRDSFGVPNNLYIIGTMNTADRSLTGLDIALRRRFTFVEMPPNYSLLEEKQIENTDVYLSQILQAMNARIEVLLGRDYCLGHAPFMPLGNTVTVKELEPIFKNTIIPLLQEYFFEDWRKIHLVLNDHKKDAVYRFITQKTIPTDIFDEEELAKFPRELWEINKNAFNYATSYISIFNPALTFSPKTSATNSYVLPNFVQGIPRESLMRTYQWENYFLIQYKENGSRAIKIYKNDTEIHRNIPNSEENMKQVLRNINEQKKLNILPEEEKNTRHLADLVFDRLGVALLQ